MSRYAALIQSVRRNLRTREQAYHAARAQLTPAQRRDPIYRLRDAPALAHIQELRRALQELIAIDQEAEDGQALD